MDGAGFAIRVECETYGIFFYADGWHGAPFEVNPATPTQEAVVEESLGFLRTLLSPDSSLEVHYASGRPFKWVLSYAVEGGIEREEMGLFFYRYLGARTKRTYQNQHLPARYLANAV